MTQYLPYKYIHITISEIWCT